MIGPVIGPGAGSAWLHWLLFAGLCAAIFFVRLLPLHPAQTPWPGPDLITAFAFAWVLRRPAYMPAALLAAALFLADLLFLRPPGLWAALAVMGLEFLRGRAQLSRSLPFAAEWGLVAIVLLFMTFGQRLILGLLLVPQPPLGLDLLRWLATLLAYPAVVLVSAYLFGVRKVAPGAIDELGHPI